MKSQKHLHIHKNTCICVSKPHARRHVSIMMPNLGHLSILSTSGGLILPSCDPSTNLGGFLVSPSPSIIAPNGPLITSYAPSSGWGILKPFIYRGSYVIVIVERLFLARCMLLYDVVVWFYVRLLDCVFPTNGGSTTMMLVVKCWLYKVKALATSLRHSSITSWCCNWETNTTSICVPASTHGKPTCILWVVARSCVNHHTSMYSTCIPSLP